MGLATVEWPNLATVCMMMGCGMQVALTASIKGQIAGMWYVSCPSIRF